MSITVQGFSTFSANAQTYISAQTLKRISRDVIVYGMGKKEKLPNRFSKTFQFTRFEKLNLPASSLSEGVTPDNSSMSISTVDCVMDQWGSYINLSDVAQITAKHPALQEGIRLLAEQAQETIDRECINLLLSNTHVNFPGLATSRATIGAADYITTSVIKSALSTLRRAGSIPVTGRLFLGLLDPMIEMDVLEDATFQAAASYSNIVALYNGEVGTWMGVRWMCSNLIPTMSRLADVVTAGAAGGGLVASTTYYVKVTQVDPSTGFEVAVTQQQTQATGVGQGTVNVTMPAAVGYTYNVYFGIASGVLYVSSIGNAPAAVVAVIALPTSGNAPPANPAVGVEVHFSWIMGQEAFAVPELMSLETFLTPSSASDSDPLNQRRKAGWKVMFKPVICNEVFIERIESASRY